MTPEQSRSIPETVRVEVTHISLYSRNPRRQTNPEYDRIKASIQVEGLDQPLVISQLPGADDYVLHSGGNTRLKILQELWQETADERFRWVDCIVKPWVKESNLLFAHLRENDLRGGLPFIDKALAVFEVKSLLETEMVVDNLSLRQLASLLTERGFGLSHTMLSKMGYAVEVLWPLIPQALAAGLGRPQVEKIRAVERASRAIWLRRRLGDDNGFNEIFTELCRRYDATEWDIQPLRDALENEIAAESDLNRQVIHLEMEAQLTGHSFSVPDPVATETAGADKVVSAAHGTGHSPRQLATEEPAAETELPASRAHNPSAALMLPTSGQPSNLDSLRTQLWECAAALATSHGLYDAVIPLPQQGLGFLLVDVPPAELRQSLDQDMLDLVSALWWQLAASSELTVAPTPIVLAHLNTNSPLHQALASHDADLLFSSVWTPDPAHLNSQLWQHLSPPDWQNLLQLMAAYRAIKQLALDTGVELWTPGRGERDGVQ